jgi:hypothetical protein
MIDMLEQLSNAVGVIARADVKRVADEINRRVMDLLGANMVKLYWVQEAENGIILTPFTFINETSNPDPRPFQVPQEHPGVLSWVFYNRKPVWFESLSTKDLTQPIKNEWDGTMIDPDLLDINPRYVMDSVACIPLTVRGEIRGLYAVELHSSGRIRSPFIALMERLGRSLSSMLWNADVYEFDQQKTSGAVQQFINGIRRFVFDPIFLEEHYRAGFVSRPFQETFAEVEARLAKLLESKHIRARSYRPSGGREYIIDDIQKEIRSSHFCVADVTGTSPNVMIEVGMMMTLGKHFLLLRRHGESAPRPFNISHLPVHEYDLGGEDTGLRIWDHSKSRFQPMDHVLDSFIRQLPAESGFSSASPWMG